MQTTDFLIVGAGIMGVTLSLELARRHPGSRIVLLEKEPQAGLHASGRNSGVLHAGFYYSADSLKARFCRDGNRELTELCLDRDLPINRCGKLVVARNRAELAGLDELLRRAADNGVELRDLDVQEAREVEPRVRTFERALFSPTTASVDPRLVLAALLDKAQAAGVQLVTECGWRGGRGRRVATDRGDIEAGYLINAAGLYADRIARHYGFAARYRVLPFKGLFLHSDEPAGALRTHIYPVPDLANPFLGVHFTVTTDGRHKVGPTAIPAFWREHYGGLARFKADELLEVVTREAGLWLRNDFRFRRLALEELRKYYRPHLVRLAAELAQGVELRHFRCRGEPGIRAQLLDIREQRLEMDFRFEGDERSFHVLNAVSPAFTCALPFSRFLCDRIEALVR